MAAVRARRMGPRGGQTGLPDSMPLPPAHIAPALPSLPPRRTDSIFNDGHQLQSVLTEIRLDTRTGTSTRRAVLPASAQVNLEVGIRAGKKARGSRAGSGSIRLGSARLGEAREPKRARAEPNSTARYTNEPSRAGSVRLASRLEARSKLLQLSLVSLFSSVQSSRSSDQCLFWSQLTRN
jgi:hypothetical protein